MSIRAIGLAYVGYPVADVTRARGFYEGILGLTPAMVEGNGTMEWVEYEVGRETFAISNAWPPSPNPGPSAALEVEDFDAAVDHVREAGVKIKTEPFESPVCRMCIISDPDGNDLIIHKLKPVSSNT